MNIYYGTYSVPGTVYGDKGHWNVSELKGRVYTGVESYPNSRLGNHERPTG